MSDKIKPKRVVDISECAAGSWSVMMGVGDSVMCGCVCLFFCKVFTCGTTVVWQQPYIMFRHFPGWWRDRERWDSSVFVSALCMTVCVCVGSPVCSLPHLCQRRCVSFMWCIAGSLFHSCRREWLLRLAWHVAGHMMYNKCSVMDCSKMWWIIDHALCLCASPLLVCYWGQMYRRKCWRFPCLS